MYKDKTGLHLGPRRLCKAREKVIEWKDRKYIGNEWKGET